MRTITQYAYGILGTRKGPWRLWWKEAEIDALRAGHAAREKNSSRIYIIVPAEILHREVEPTAEQLAELHGDHYAAFRRRKMVQLQRRHIAARHARNR